MDNFCKWPCPQGPVELNAGEVHVWYVDLAAHLAQADAFMCLLNKDEQDRANRFQFMRDRERFIIARGVLRKLLSQYEQLPPEELCFHYSEYGKPYLASKKALQFNLSHADTKALYAVALNQSVGVDIENNKRDVSIDAIAERFFSSNESQIIQNLAGAQKRRAFFTGWVRKEAYLKALGTGLNYSLAGVEVTLLPGQSPKILSLQDKQQTPSEWFLYALKPAAHYEAALVVHGKPLLLKTWAWPG